ncbi:hypothetical protein V8E36_003721 [Tilletia maclaganii]
MFAFIKTNGRKSWPSSDEVPAFWARDGAAAPTATGTKYVGSTCKASSECFSGNCQLISGTTKSTCQRQPLGGPCTRGGNCVTRYCNTTSHTCAPKIGPTSTCSFDLQCTSGRCVSSISNRDSQGEILDPNFKQLHTKQCDYLRVGQARCNNYLDCYDSPCSPTGYCQRGKVGDYCQFSYHCGGGGLCSRDGVCYVPTPKAQPNGELCLGNDQCSSNYCFFSPYKVVRPSLLDRSKNVTVTDGICADRKDPYGYYYG